VRVVIVPAKEFTSAKERLADALPAPARAALARAMLEDVLAVLAGAPVDRVVVVTPDAEVAAVAERGGALVVREPESRGHTAAVARGVALCQEWGATVMLTVPGDLPCLTPEEVRRILDACSSAPAAVFVPSRSGLGTNAACLAPPDAVPLRFGEPSFADHLAAARARGIEPVILSLAGAGLDIDRPEDLAALRQAGPRTRAAQTLGAPPAPPRRAPELEVFGIRGIPELRPGDDLAALTLGAASDRLLRDGHRRRPRTGCVPRPRRAPPRPPPRVAVVVRTLVVHCHPDPESFTATVRDRAIEALRERGDEVRLTDLYAIGFDPVLSKREQARHLEPGPDPSVADHAADLQWCQQLVLVYPTWWSGQPAMLKGWFDRVLVKDVAFELPPDCMVTP